MASFLGLYALHKDYKVAHQSFIQHFEPTPLTIQDLGDWTSFFIGLQLRRFWVSTPSTRITRSRTNPLLNTLSPHLSQFRICDRFSLGCNDVVSG
ncbi:hypothetical protein JHK86_053458 [Glycine max]|nr:hypothetical protein JHK86_053458 [Glycine max]